jgi:predicted permease
MLRRNPGFTGIAVIVLALGIGVNTGVFSVAQWLCLRPAPFAEPQRVVRLFASREGRVSEGFCYPDYLALKEQMTSLSDLAAVEYCGTTLRGEPWSKDLTVAVVSRNFFSVLGIQACVGYVFTENDDDALKSRSGIVISHELWRSQFGANPRLVGSPITLDGRSYTLLGVAPADFKGERYTMPPDVWYPVETWGHRQERASRDSSSFSLVGRLRTGVSAPEAQREAAVIFSRLPLADPITRTAPTPVVIAEPDYRLQGGAGYSLFRGGIAALVLLIACANISSLLLARAEAGIKDMAVRRSLGCTRLRLVRQVFIEGWLLALISLPGSLFLAHWAIGILRASVSPAASDPLSGVHLNLSTVGFCVGITFLATLAFGSFPALYASRVDLLNALKTDLARASHTGRTLCGLNTLVAGQLALGLILTATASLLFRSYLNCCTTDLGFERNNILLAQVCPGGGIKECMAFFDQLLPQVRSLPGVKDAGLGITAPYVFTQCGWTHQVSLPGHSVTDQTACAATYNVVDPHFLATLEIPVLRGRGFEEHEGRSGSKVVVINETLAKRLWPESDPVGQFVRIGPSDSDTAQVIGVVRDGKYHSITDPVKPYVYVPLGARPGILPCCAAPGEDRRQSGSLAGTFARDDPETGPDHGPVSHDLSGGGHPCQRGRAGGGRETGRDPESSGTDPGLRGSVRGRLLRGGTTDAGTRHSHGLGCAAARHHPADPLARDQARPDRSAHRLGRDPDLWAGAKVGSVSNQSRRSDGLGRIWSAADGSGDGRLLPSRPARRADRSDGGAQTRVTATDNQLERRPVSGFGRAALKTGQIGRRRSVKWEVRSGKYAVLRVRRSTCDFKLHT